MSSISSATAMQSFSPLSRLQTELASEVSAGTISADDQTALSSALNDIDTAMKSQSQSGGKPPSPDAMKSKIDSLIAGEVSDGKLTADQAAELKNVFSNAFQGGPGGPGGAGGLPPGPPPGGDSDDSTSTSSSTSSSSSDTDVATLMKDFLKLIQDSQGSSSASYSANGGTSLLSQIQALVVNYQA